jgi:hypothetical protein
MIPAAEEMDPVPDGGEDYGKYQFDDGHRDVKTPNQQCGERHGQDDQEDQSGMAGSSI